MFSINSSHVRSCTSFRQACLLMYDDMSITLSIKCKMIFIYLEYILEDFWGKQIDENKRKKY